MDKINEPIFHLERLKENILFLNDFFTQKELSWTFVIKAFCNYSPEFISELVKLPINSVASDNEQHLKIFKGDKTDIETWYLNYSGANVDYNWVDVELTHSLLNIQKKTCLMLTLDNDRFGSQITDPTNDIFKNCCSRVGAYLNCEKMPTRSFFEKWSSFNFPAEFTQSLGTSVTFEHATYLQDNRVNHFRIGEIALTGRLIGSNNKIKGMRHDVFTSTQQVSYHFLSNLKNK